MYILSQFFKEKNIHTQSALATLISEEDQKFTASSLTQQLA